MNSQTTITRPLIPAVFFYIMGIGLATSVDISSKILFLSIGCIIAFGIVVNRMSLLRPYQVFVFGCLFILMGMIHTNIATKVPEEWESINKQMSELEGTVLSVDKQTDTNSRYVLNDVIINGQAYKGKVIASSFYDDIQNPDIFELGTRVRIETEVEYPDQARNPKSFDYRKYLQRQGVYAQIGANSDQYTVIGKAKVGMPTKLIESTITIVRKTINQWVGGDEGAIVIGMIIGDKTDIPTDIEASFKKNGVAHILAISGLHVGFLVALMLGLLKACRAKKESQFVITTVVLIVYCLLTGACPSTIRSTIMAVILLGGFCLGRRADSMNAVAVAALVILLFKPLDLFEVGFQLSFAAVIGITLFSRRITNHLIFLPKLLAQSIAVVIAAQIGTIPVMAYHFNTLSAMAFIANIPFVFLAGIIVNLSFVLVLISPIPFINALLGIIIKALVALLTSCSEQLSQMPWAEFVVCSPSIILLTGSGILAWLLSRECPRKLVKWRLQLSMLVVILISIWTYGAPYLNHSAKMVVLDVGQGDAIHIQTPDHKNILIDTGGMETWYTGNFEPGEDVIVPYFLKSGIKTIDLLILTHAHADHIGGVPAVIKTLNVKNVVVAEADWYQEKLVGYHGNIVEVQKGNQLNGKKSKLTIMNPTWETMGEGDNNDSIVVMLEMNGTNILLTGDSETEVCTDIAQYIDGVNIIKVPHHGGKSSMSETYFNHVNAQIAIASCGANNRYGHPHADIVNAYVERGTTFYRTDQQGAVMVTIKPDKIIQVKTMIQ